MLRLPIDDYLEQISQIIIEKNLILTAEPGAGKTTRVPPYLLSHFPKKIFVLVPRRVLAVAAAHRIAEENNWTIGQEVGYQVRFDSKFNQDTRLIFMTEAILTKKLLHDPELKDTSLVVLDEFHERSIHSDIALGLIKELQLLGSQIKLLIMSATIDTTNLGSYLNPSEILNVPGKLFPMTINYSQKNISVNTGPIFIEKICDAIKTALQNTQNDILVFLPGVSEIQRTQKLLLESYSNFLKNISILPLHGNLKLEEQKNAISKGIQQRVILSTNVAESSLTVEGVDTVIDSGLMRRARYDLNTNFQRLETAKISVASATQRAGRSARQHPGHVYRLWSKIDESTFAKNETPEILRSDLSETLLYLASMGNSHFEQFLWFEKPKYEFIENAIQFLQKINAIDVENKITRHGQDIARMPLPPRLAQLVSLGKEWNCLALAARIASVIAEKFPNHSINHSIASTHECDIKYRLDHLTEHKNYLQQIRKAEEQILNFLGEAKNNLVNIEPILITKLLLHSYPDRICRKRDKSGTRAIMVGGRGVTLDTSSQVKKSEFFVALDGIEGAASADTVISVASGFTKEILLNEFQNQIKISQKIIFNAENRKFYLAKSKTLFDLAIEESSLSTPNSQDIQAHISEFLMENFDLILKENTDFAHFWMRWSMFVKLLKNDTLLDGFSFNQQRLKDIFEFLSSQVNSNNINDYINYNLTSLFTSQIPLALLDHFNKQIPERIRFPNGKSALLQWSEERGPYIESRIQDFFGLKETPKIFNNEIPLTLVMLGPNYRPVQITKDLNYFWKNSYKEIRKELKARYPKHNWPEDP